MKIILPQMAKSQRDNSSLKNPIFKANSNLLFETNHVDFDRSTSEESEEPVYIFEQKKAVSGMKAAAAMEAFDAKEFLPTDEALLFRKMAFLYFGIVQFSSIGVDKNLLQRYAEALSGVGISDSSFKTAIEKLLSLGFVLRTALYNNKTMAPVYHFYLPSVVEEQSVSKELASIVLEIFKAKGTEFKTIDEIEKARYSSNQLLGTYKLTNIQTMCAISKTIAAFLEKASCTAVNVLFGDYGKRDRNTKDFSLCIENENGTLEIFILVARSVPKWTNELEAQLEEIAAQNSNKREKATVLVLVEAPKMAFDACNRVQRFENEIDIIFSSDVELFNNFAFSFINLEDGERQLILKESKLQKAQEIENEKANEKPKEQKPEPQPKPSEPKKENDTNADGSNKSQQHFQNGQNRPKPQNRQQNQQRNQWQGGKNKNQQNRRPNTQNRRPNQNGQKKGASRPNQGGKPNNSGAKTNN